MSVLEKLLETRVRESKGIEADLVSLSKEIFELVLDQNILFELLPENLHVIAEPLTEIHLPMAGNTRMNNKGEFYKKKAVLLHDGITAAGSSAHNYIYKTKGLRAYIFEDGHVCIITPYALIDDRGFVLANEIWDGIGEFSISRLNNVSPLIELFETIQSHDNESFRKACISAGLIRMITNIKKPFKKDYCLEYLLTPPDVDFLSDFSTDMRQALWDIALSHNFEKHVGTEWQSNAMELLVEMHIAPTPTQIISYINRLRHNKSLDTQQLAERIDALERNLTGSINNISQELRNPAFWKEVFNNNTSLTSKTINTLKGNYTAQNLKLVIIDMLNIFKNQIENRGLWKELWLDEKPRSEKTVQNLFFSMASVFCEAYDLDITPEANSGNGPVDFKISTGNACKLVIEFKLSTNGAALHGYDTQFEIYKRGDNTDQGIFVLINVGSLGNTLTKLNAIKRQFDTEGFPASDIFYIDGMPKASASKRKH
ncbi:hypothetical protein ALQ72_01404 [Pseudomonas syringae pv. maculicola]|uniref:hypothetical protein n=1 Tax=Pseudomonas syringae group genomosp. 3 TaxID=251701 RepID=UPI0006BA09A6|nr:hypothetical protein [Pseudomonas syringae group genomosp. 3]KPC07902.1 Uncharacterized protein AC503_4904 [Pseudomonas syringae pv. maculicola]MBM0213126.1 hypothetical protein [Pseudomonas syringae pv. maculicola]RMM76843.1 hypothetical protein ALQ72_01404 [Pseudomonas syringae pv. maculicola]